MCANCNSGELLEVSIQHHFCLSLNPPCVFSCLNLNPPMYVLMSEPESPYVCFYDLSLGSLVWWWQLLGRGIKAQRPDLLLGAEITFGYRGQVQPIHWSIYRFSADSIKIPVAFFTEVEKRTIKKPLSKKNTGVTISEFKLYYRAIAMKTAWCCPNTDM